VATPLITLRALDSANFRTSRRADDANDRIMAKLGLKFRYAPARLALSRSLELDDIPPPLQEEDAEELGKTIIGRHLFGDEELALWIAMIIERADLKEPSVEAIQDQVKRHWHRGILLLAEEWEHCEEEYERFLLQIAERAGLMRARGAKRNGTDVNSPAVAELGPIILTLGDPGTDIVTQKPATWHLNGRGGSPHVAIMGTLGTGKTRTAMHLITKVHETTSCPVLLFDMAKGDIASDRELIRALGARVVVAPKESVPLDVLWLPSSDEGEVTNAAMRFRESFVRVARSKPGGVQLDYLREAAQRAYHEQLPITISSVSRSLQAVYAENQRRPDAVTATFNDLTSWRLFEPRLSPADFFRQSWIIDVHEAPETAQRFIVFLILDALYAFSKSLPDSAIDKRGNRELRLTVGIDEARKILGYGQPSLISLVRESRSKGLSIFLISQSPDDYDQEEDNFLENVGLALCFKTNAASYRALKALLGQSVDLGSLPPGVAVTRFPGQAGVSRVLAWH
jgi:DNA sulfur modification protein DndE